MGNSLKIHLSVLRFKTSMRRSGRIRNTAFKKAPTWELAE